MTFSLPQVRSAIALVDASDRRKCHAEFPIGGMRFQHEVVAAMVVGVAEAMAAGIFASHVAMAVLAAGTLNLKP